MSDPTHGSTGTRECLNRGLTLRTAVGLMDELGVRELSLRRLGRELGVERPSTRYIPSQTLLDGVETVIDELYANADVELMPQDGWPDYLPAL